MRGNKQHPCADFTNSVVGTKLCADCITPVCFRALVATEIGLCTKTLKMKLARSISCSRQSDKILEKAMSNADDFLTRLERATSKGKEILLEFFQRPETLCGRTALNKAFHTDTRFGKDDHWGSSIECKNLLLKFYANRE